MHKYGAIVLIGFMVLTFAIGLAGSMYTGRSVQTWYPALKKPAWNPPSWLFGPVWTLLYICIAISGWLVWREAPEKTITLPMIFFLIQLILNGLWSYLFFGRQNPGAAFVDIVILWLLIALYAVFSWDVSRIASLLFVPYFLWVGFASLLNFSIWTLNK